MNDTGPIIDLSGKGADLPKAFTYTAVDMDEREFNVCTSAHAKNQLVAVVAEDYVRLALVVQVEGVSGDRNKVTFKFQGPAKKL